MEPQRLNAIHQLGLLDVERVPVFEETTQTAAHFLDAPICILSIVDRDRQWFKSAVGLSRLGLMNDLASSRQLPRHESFCNAVVDTCQAVSLENVAEDPVLQRSILVQRYGIRAYLGVPLLNHQGDCVGTLAVWELKPRQFSDRERAFLELMARWCMSEYERNRLLEMGTTWGEAAPTPKRSPSDLPTPAIPAPPIAENKELSLLKAELMAQMTQELCTPLTSVLGMTSMLKREIYGPLTAKQKEYLDIVHSSGQYLLSLVNEVVELGTLDENDQTLDLSPVDIEMLCQQALSTLEQAAQRRDQQVQLTVEPGYRIWLLDKNKVRQMLYHLVFNVIQSSSSESVIRIHISRKQNQLQLMVWTSHPWLGDGLPHAELAANPLMPLPVASIAPPHSAYDRELNPIAPNHLDFHPGYLASNPDEFPPAILHPIEISDSLGHPVYASPELGEDETLTQKTSRQGLGLLLSQQLVKLHGGEITIQGALETGYRYVVILPQLTSPSA